MLCPNCKGEVLHPPSQTTWDDGPSPWSTGGFVDETTSRYLKYGFIGAILGIFHSILSGIQLISFVTYPEFLYAVIIFGLPTLLLGFIQTFLIAMGFLGLHYKYDDSVCKYVLWFSILYLLIYGVYGVTAVFATIITPIFIAMAMILTFSGFVTSIVIAWALWRIKDRSGDPSLTTIVAMLGLVGSLIINLMGIIAGSIASVFIAILFAYFFKIEQEYEVRQVIKSW